MGAKGNDGEDDNNSNNNSSNNQNKNKSTMEDAVEKAAKKCLKKKEGETMKLKALSKKVAKKLSSDFPDLDMKKIKEVLKSKSDKFSMDGKMVTLKKRKSTEGGDEPASKKQKTEEGSEEKQKASSSSSVVITDDNIVEWRKEHKIVLKDATDDQEGIKKEKELNLLTQYYPYSTFDAPGCVQNISSALLKQCTVANGFEKPSPIQAQCWPVLLEAVNGKKRDIVGIAETGSGKTLAFAMPALSIMSEEDKSNKKSKRSKSPRMLILSPTRELAMQSHDVLEEFGAVVNLKSLVVYGGVPKHPQVAELKRGVDCVVATPGRLKDLINDGSIDLSQVHHLILDEADRMIDVGFEEDVRYIIEQCKTREDGRQTAMFSATWPAAIRQIAMDFMTEPVRVYVGFEAIVGSNGENAMDDSLSANKRVKQIVEVVEDRARDPRLRQLLKKYHSKRDNRVLIFGLYKKEAERLEYSLRRDGYNVCSIHGNKNQSSRTEALQQFKSGSCPLMIATDVAARGLDIPNVEVVINFTFPLTIEDYVHRIGRTGRAGKNGTSHTFFQPGDKSHAGELQQVMRQAGQEVPEDLQKFGSTIKKKEHKLYGNFGPRSGPMKKATKITFDY